MPPLKPLPKRPFTLPPPEGSRYNRGAVYLAVAVAVAVLPYTLKYQKGRVEDFSDKQRRMFNLLNQTSTQLTAKYGKPAQVRDYSLQEGSFAGPNIGMKRFHRMNSPEYAEQMKSPVVWSFPEFSMIREVTWKLPDSYLTVWLHEPRSVIDLTGPETEIVMPSTADGAWVPLDNYRVGNNLVKNAPTAK